MSVKNIKIAFKVLLALGLMAVFSVGVTGTALWIVRSLDTRYSDLFDQESQAALWLARSNSLLNATARDTYVMVAESEGAAVKKAGDALDSDTKGMLERLGKAITAMPAIADEGKAMRATIEGLVALAKDVRALALKNADTEAHALIVQKFDPAYMDVRVKYRALIDRVDKETQVKSDGTSAYSSAANFWLALIGSLGVLAIVALALVFARRTITLPIRHITETMHTLATGRTDVDVIGEDRGDEIGDMARAVRVFKDSAVERLRLEAAAAADRAAREKRVAEVERLIDAFERHVGDIMGAVSSAATELEATADSMTKTASRTNDRAAAAAQEASMNVQTVAAASEELSASISEIGSQVTRSSTIAGQAVNEAEQTNTRVQGLVDQAHHIGEIVNLITSIASQTNLLALNATIEAARAGEAGKGFAVVASEVKNLANQTAKATEDISRQIQAMQQATDGAANAIDGIGRTISTISQVASTIAAAVEEQGAATGEIARNVQAAATGTRTVSANVADVSEAATLTGAAATQVLGASSELARQSSNLKMEVETFLAGIRAT
jgi:methyl-accepting chemotaxis protein